MEHERQERDAAIRAAELAAVDRVYQNQRERNIADQKAVERYVKKREEEEDLKMVQAYKIKQRIRGQLREAMPHYDDNAIRELMKGRYPSSLDNVPVRGRHYHRDDVSTATLRRFNYNYYVDLSDSRFVIVPDAIDSRMDAVLRDHTKRHKKSSGKGPFVFVRTMGGTSRIMRHGSW